MRAPLYRRKALHKSGALISVVDEERDLWMRCIKREDVPSIGVMMTIARISKRREKTTWDLRPQRDGLRHQRHAPAAISGRGRRDAPWKARDTVPARVDSAAAGSAWSHGPGGVPGRAAGAGRRWERRWALIASGPVVIMAATFMNATFDRLPLDDDDDEIIGGQQYQSNRQRHHNIDVPDVYGITQNLLTNGNLPFEGCTWAPGRAQSKS
ncbi:hypothetical protein DH2020_018356 [Rehmannia glutinosa]|uniref:Uncharacterized protein n=1 Tax=Rehmannia glutinosa TaxID=99300 RepID=A0ABR0WK41_REHGL